MYRLQANGYSAQNRSSNIGTIKRGLLDVFVAVRLVRWKTGAMPTFRYLSARRRAIWHQARIIQGDWRISGVIWLEELREPSGVRGKSPGEDLVTVATAARLDAAVSTTSSRAPVFVSMI